MTASKNFTAEVLLSADVDAQLVNGPAVRVSKSATQTLSTGAFGIITFDVETYDSDGLHSTSVNTSRITIPSGFPGVWRFSATAYFAAGTVFGTRSAFFIKNNAGNALGEDGRPGTASTTICKPYDEISLVAGDYVELWMFQDSGASLNCTASTTMTASYARTTP